MWYKFFLMFIFIPSSFAYAQDSKPVDWDKMEAQFYSALKDTQGHYCPVIN